MNKGAVWAPRGTTWRLAERGLFTFSEFAMLLPRSLILGLALLRPVFTISSGNCVSFDSKAGGFQVAATGSARVLVAPDEWPGVVRAAGDFAKDLSTVRDGNGKDTYRCERDLINCFSN
ncbi:hypothetical protein RHS04_09706 [Rhizoctonia solani]|uniref:Uncharacterized protein n=1 Tax=Rhizoctonia solani TaxID=456999 RepID=A0A8H7LF81_9AGAM|nr:hypothetical protein RHS04_09706 [Rhizoctonia solani]